MGSSLIKTIETSLTLAPILCCIALSACGGGDNDAEACAPLQAAITSAEAAATEATTQLRAGLTAAHATPPVAGTDTCTIDVNRGLATHRAVRVETIQSFDPPKARNVRGYAQSAGLVVTDCALYPEAERTRHLGELQSAVAELSTGHDLVILERSRVEPVMNQGQGTFTPGRLEAQLLVWSYAERRFVCAADVTSESGERVGVSNQRLRGDQLNEDLDRRAALSGARELRAVAQ